MLGKPSLIGAVAVALLFPLPASPVAPSLTPVVSTSPTGLASANSALIPVASTFIAVTAASSVLIPVASTFIPVGALGDDFICIKQRDYLMHGPPPNFRYWG